LGGIIFDRATFPGLALSSMGACATAVSIKIADVPCGGGVTRLLYPSRRT